MSLVDIDALPSIGACYSCQKLTLSQLVVPKLRKYFGRDGHVTRDDHAKASPSQCRIRPHVQSFQNWVKPLSYQSCGTSITRVSSRGSACAFLYSRNLSAVVGRWSRQSLLESGRTWSLRSGTNLSLDIPSSLNTSNNCTAIGSFLGLHIAHLAISVTATTITTTTKNSLKVILCLDERLLFVEKATSLQLALWVVGHQSNDPGSSINY